MKNVIQIMCVTAIIVSLGSLASAGPVMWVNSETGATGNQAILLGTTGTTMYATGYVFAPRGGISLGPDGMLYVAGTGSNTIVTFDPTDGSYVGVFAADGLSAPNGLTFGPNGDLYVNNETGNNVTRYDGLTGALIGVFASGLSAPRGGICFGPDNDLYVTSAGSGDVKVFNGTTGVFQEALSGTELVTPNGMAFGPDGNLYVNDEGSNHVVRIMLDEPGNEIGVFASSGLVAPRGGIGFYGDTLYVASAGSDEIIAFDSTTGAKTGVFSSEVTVPNGLYIVPEPATVSLLALAGLALLRRRR